MEGHRFFDLVRWGIADQVLNLYVSKEKDRRSYLKSSGGFVKGKMNITQSPTELLRWARVAGNTLVQNPGY